MPPQQAHCHSWWTDMMVTSLPLLMDTMVVKPFILVSSRKVLLPLFPEIQSPSLMPSSVAEHLWQPLLTPSPISCGPHRLFAPTLPLPTFCFILAPNSSSYSSQTHRPLLPGKQVGWLLPVDLSLSLCTSRPTPSLIPSTIADLWMTSHCCLPTIPRRQCKQILIEPSNLLLPGNPLRPLAYPHS